MRIIKKSKKIRLDCPYCGCLFVLRLGEVRGLETQYKYIYCPECRRQIEMNGIEDIAE